MTRTRRTNNFSDLFFFRRRPLIRGISRDWQRPASEEAYQFLLESNGFISVREIEGENEASHPVIRQDLEDLDQHLLPAFFELNQESKYYQNQYYLYQWIFALGAFMTITFGTITLFGSYNFTVPPSETANLTSVQQTYSTTPFLSFGILASLVAAATAFFATVSNRRQPLSAWQHTRLLAEGLRTHYFRYLSHLPPYEREDRIQKLREVVLIIRSIKEEYA